MPITSREWDVLQFESEMRMRHQLQEWKRGFLKGRLPEPETPLEEETPPQIMPTEPPQVDY